MPARFPVNAPDPLPWERQRGEPEKAWQAFRIFMDLSPNDRTLTNVARALGRSKQLAKRWANDHDWYERVRARDVELERVRIEADARALGKLREKWLIRLEHEAELLYQAAKLMRDRAHRMLKWPYLKEKNFREKCKNCGERYIKTVYEPSGWRFRDAAYFERKASEMARMAFEMIGFKVESPISGVSDSAPMSAEDAAVAMAAIEARRAGDGETITPDDILED